MTRPTPTTETAKELAVALQTPVAAYLVARTLAEVTRDAVDAYAAPLLATFNYVGEDGDKITAVADMYLIDGDCIEFYDALDAAHAANGYDVPARYCPALVAENLASEAARVVMSVGETFMGVSVDDCLQSRDGLNKMKKYRDLLVGLAVQYDNATK